MKNKPEDIALAFGQYAQMYADKYFNVEHYQNALKAFYEHSDPNGNYLDIACGPGNLTSHLLTQYPSANVLGIDIADKMLELAKKFNPTAHFKNASCENLLSVNQKFDGILCGFVLPYLNRTEVQKLIQDVSELLNPKGTLFISGNLGNYASSTKQGPSSGNDPDLFSFKHSQSFLEHQLTANHFKIIDSFKYYRQYEGFSADEIAIVAIKT